jgi:high affinity sulfate transporter 1
MPEDAKDPAAGAGAAGATGLLRNYPRAWLRPDTVAGLTAAAVVVPKAMAYATIAGLPVQVGLYTAFIPMVIYALTGSSRPLSVSTTTTIAILTAAALGLAVPGGDAGQLATAAGTLAVMVGLMLVLASVLRLGFVANFISEPVLVGFKSAIGVVIVVDQLPKLLGIHVDKAGFFRDVASIIGHVPDASSITVVLSVAIIALIFGLERFLPRAPAPLIAVGAAIAASALLGLQDAGVAVVGVVPRGLPGLVLPSLDLARQMWPAALGIALMSFTESIAAGRAFAAAQEPRPAPNRELLALGLANAGGGLFGSMPAGGGTSQTAVNRFAGAKSQMAELVTAAGALATLVLLAPLIGLMPKAALAAVVIVYSLDLIQPAEFAEIRGVRKAEFHWALVAFAGVVLLGTLQGIVVAVVVSLLSLAHQAYNPPVYALGRKRGTTVFRQLSSEHPDDETWPGLLMLRVEGRVFFANAQRIGDAVWPMIERTKPRVVLMDCRAIIDLEYTALKMFGEAEERLRRDGIELWLAALNPAVFAMVERSKLGAALGHERMFLSMQAAVEKFQSGRT